VNVVERIERYYPWPV